MIFDDYRNYSATRILQDNRREASRQTCELITLAFLKSASENLGFGEARLNRLMEGARVVIDHVGEERIDIGELKNWAAEKNIILD